MDTSQSVAFGGGCFWCTEAVFSQLKGVLSVTPGFAGGDVEDPTYDEVVAGGTGHAEVVRVEYDPDIISLHDLLVVFFATHDPTTPNRQGNDIGPQYRSAIFYTTDKQKEEINFFIKKLEKKGGPSIVTEVSELEEFYESDESHKDYFKKHPERAYCQAVISPKVEKVQKEFNTLLKTHGQG